MNKIFIISLILIAYAIQGNSQEITTEKKIEKTTFWVNGNCEMCQKRIEKAALKTKGVKMASWNIETKRLTVIYKTKKCTVDDIKESIANVGHDSKGHKATDEVQ